MYVVKPDLISLYTGFFPARVPAGLPSVSLPPFEVVTPNRTYTFGDITTQLGSGIFVVPFVSILGNVAISKAFGKFVISKRF